MTLALMVSLICVGSHSVHPVLMTAVRRTEECEQVSSDSQCNLCPCWKGTTGCAKAGCAYKSCSYSSIVQWGTFGMSDANGCVDMDLLPVPQDQWVFWIREAP